MRKQIEQEKSNSALTDGNSLDSLEYFEVQGDYNAPEIQKGDLVVAQKGIEPIPGDFVLFDLPLKMAGGLVKTHLAKLKERSSFQMYVENVYIIHHIEDVTNIRCVTGFLRRTKRYEWRASDELADFLIRKYGKGVLNER